MLTLGDLNLIAKSKTGVGSSLLVSCHIYCLIQPTKKIFEVGKIQLRLIWIIRAWKHGKKGMETTARVELGLGIASDQRA